jgi:NADP-dependent 3-hydroxy acid dehydrogenase YdfG
MMVKALEENNAKVYIVGRRKELLEKVAKEEAVRLNPDVPIQ